MKGQIESIIFTIVFLAIGIAVVIAGIIALLGLRGATLQRTIELMEGQSKPINFLSGLAMLKTDNENVFEQSLRVAVTGHMPLSYEHIENMPLAAAVQSLAHDSGFKDWRFVISSSVDMHASPALELGSFNTMFCGDLADQLEYGNPNNIWAWCEDTTKDRCSSGRTYYDAGQTRCRLNQRCCRLLNYDLNARKYTSVETGVTLCGPDTSGWSGICRFSCLSGEYQTDSSSQCPGRKLWFLDKNQYCCRPVEQLRYFDKDWLDIMTVPLIYSYDGRTNVGKIDVWLGLQK